MRRDERLQELSRDHHHALVLAVSCVKAADGAAPNPDAMWARVREEFTDALDPHFLIEERLLLPALEALGEQALVRRTQEDHAQLRALVADTAMPCGERLRSFGELLKTHIDFEEHELFDVAQERLDDQALSSVAQASRKTGA